MNGQRNIFDFFQNGVDFAGLTTYLDSLDVATATAECLKLKLKQQRALFEAAKGKRSLSIADFVPPNTAIGEQVIHKGRNTALLFRDFKKRCGRFSVDGPVHGYNDQTFMCFTGPGYFTAQPGAHGQVLFDYRQVPDAAPPNWPKPRPNSQAIFPLYNDLVDVMRGVSERVTIGQPGKAGKVPMDSYFILVRQ